MSAKNSTRHIGRLTRDPQVVAIQDGSIVNFSLAVDRFKKDAPPLFLDFKAFGKRADFIAQWCKKGKQVSVEGETDVEEWDDKTTGDKRKKVVFIVQDLMLLGKKDDVPASGGDDEGSEEEAPPKPAPKKAPAAPPKKPKAAPVPVEDDDEDEDGDIQF